MCPVPPIDIIEMVVSPPIKSLKKMRYITGEPTVLTGKIDFANTIQIEPTQILEVSVERPILHLPIFDTLQGWTWANLQYFQLVKATIHQAASHAPSLFKGIGNAVVVGGNNTVNQFHITYETTQNPINLSKYAKDGKLSFWVRLNDPLPVDNFYLKIGSSGSTLNYKIKNVISSNNWVHIEVDLNDDLYSDSYDGINVLDLSNITYVEFLVEFSHNFTGTMYFYDFVADFKDSTETYITSGNIYITSGNMYLTGNVSIDSGSTTIVQNEIKTIVTVKTIPITGASGGQFVGSGGISATTINKIILKNPTIFISGTITGFKGPTKPILWLGGTSGNAPYPGSGYVASGKGIIIEPGETMELYTSALDSFKICAETSGQPIIMYIETK